MMVHKQRDVYDHESDIRKAEVSVEEYVAARIYSETRLWSRGVVGEAAFGMRLVPKQLASA
jgi:hypothetical protein